MILVPVLNPIIAESFVRFVDSYNGLAVLSIACLELYEICQVGDVGLQLLALVSQCDGLREKKGRMRPLLVSWFPFLPYSVLMVSILARTFHVLAP